jgi:hypothetical protein
MYYLGKWLPIIYKCNRKNVFANMDRERDTILRDCDACYKSNNPISTLSETGQYHVLAS